MFRGSDILSHRICKYEVLVRSLNSSYDRVTCCRTRSGVGAPCGGYWVFKLATILDKIMWDTLAECNASTIDRSSPKTKVLWAKSCPPPPPPPHPSLPHAMLFGRKALLKSLPTLQGRERILQEFGIKGKVSNTCL